ncbi:MAG: transporter, family, multidrug resistance protein [Thermoanaerobacteraceae bacterium]|nr:transporter, family, multidrug resistance protein [Thermoanaerobacteraceae bacterium]
MEQWKKNLIILFAAQFLIRISTTTIKPYLPFFLQELGVSLPEKIAFWAGLLSSVNFLAQALFSPMWGSLSDKYGRKLMSLRTILAIGVSYFFMYGVTNPYQLLGLRFLMGTLSGFNAAATALIATTTPVEHLGYAIGVLQTGRTGGTIFGPAIGGIIADIFGYRGSFIIAGFITLVSFPLILFGVKEEKICYDVMTENKEKSAKKAVGFGEAIKIINKSPIILFMFLGIFLSQFGLQSMDAMLPIFIKSIYMGTRLNTAVSIIFAISAIAVVIMAPYWGKLGDKIGHQIILLISIVGSGMFTFFQVFTDNIIQLAVLRFLSAGFDAGILPSAHAMIAKSCPEENRGSVYGVASGITAIGNFSGPMTGGIIAAFLGIRSIFPVTAALMLAGAAAIYVNGRMIKNNEIQS